MPVNELVREKAITEDTPRVSSAAHSMHKAFLLLADDGKLTSKEVTMADFTSHQHGEPTASNSNGTRSIGV
jgi:hypothetical protein